MTFQSEYKFFNSVVVCKTYEAATLFKHEKDTYSFIENIATKDYWKYLRVDTQNQMGFPDILLLRQEEYLQIESKLLKKKKLRSLQDDLRWEFGQLSYMKRALTLRLNYILVVAKINTNLISFIKGDFYAKPTNNTNFIEQLFIC